jgi:Ala-tRNA(Pro) deacylase
MSATIFERLSEKLTAASVAFAVTRHPPVFTSEQAAAVRGVPLCTGAKALVVKAGDDFVLLVVPADRKLDSKKARSALGVKAMRFASREEVEQITGLLPGSIPPFGSLFSLPTRCDPALALNERINFNAGDHSLSISLTSADYLAVERPVISELT